MTINTYGGLISIIRQLNGKFRTVKINDFYSLVDFLNQRFPDLKIIKRKQDNSILESNSWLSGFIDSDGHFLLELEIKMSLVVLN